MPLKTSRRVFLILLAVVALPLLAGCFSPLRSNAPPGAYTQLNQGRAQNGAGPVGACGTLAAAAQALADNLSAHPGLTGHPGLSQRVAGYGSHAIGEVAVSQRSTIDGAIQAWLSSQRHRDIFLGSYQHVGIGYAPAGGYWVATFGSGGRC